MHGAAPLAARGKLPANGIDDSLSVLARAEFLGDPALARAAAAAEADAAFARFRLLLRGRLAVGRAGQAAPAT